MAIDYMITFMDVSSMQMILFSCHTQRMLHVCDLFAFEFDVKFNSTKSVAMRCGPRYDVVCASLQ